ncbi:GNAT family N-acetyltransferase [Thermodesulfobacteriota bacterium]
MELTLRPGTSEDAEICGEICYEAFKTIAEQHNFPPDFPSPEIAIEGFKRWLSHPEYYSVVAELDGRVVGSNFLDERSIIYALGPVTVAPAVQNRSIGRQLMRNALNRVATRRCPGVRLVQNAYHNRSLCLYAKLGFEVREILGNMQGPPLSLQIPCYNVRQAVEEDIKACNRLCRQVHGHDRNGELSDAVGQGTAAVVDHGNRITGYATVIGFWGHAVGESNEDLKALIGAAAEFVGQGFFLPLRNQELLCWCLEHGLRMVQPYTLMSMGLYNEPKGAFLPSIGS